MTDHIARYDFALQATITAGKAAAQYFRDRGSLVVEAKGDQDWVSEADKNVETLLRGLIEEAWPEDGIIGEEHAPKVGTSGFDWVIDPIDGTTNFVNGIPAWTVVLAGVAEGKTQLGVTHDPNVDETFAARRGHGATLNGVPMQVANGVALASGSVSVGYSNRIETRHVVPLISDLLEAGALFHRNASGALSLAYVAAGRLVGYLEQHMNAWDCLAGQLMIEEAGGTIEQQNADEMIREGGRVVAGTRDVFPALQQMADAHWRS